LENLGKLKYKYTISTFSKQ